MLGAMSPGCSPACGRTSCNSGIIVSGGQGDPDLLEANQWCATDLRRAWRGCYKWGMGRKGHCGRERTRWRLASEEWRDSPPVVVILASLLLTLAGCASTSTTDDGVISAYPSQSLVSLLKDSNSPPPAPTLGASAQASSSTAIAGSGPPTSSASAPTAVAPAAHSTSSEDADAVAAAYPSVSLFDFLTSTKTAPH